MNHYAKKNKKWWNEVTPIHATSRLYNLTSFKKGISSLGQIELQEMGKVTGKTLLHLMCHFGMDTLSWAREGANVTGVDFSEDAIALAKKLSKETQLPATFICADIFDLPKTLHKKYDIVFTSHGVLCWIPDLKKWANLISRYLNKGGIFYITELHPFTNMLSYDFKIDYDYFENGPLIDDSDGTYTDWNAGIHGATYVWNHTLSELVNALISEGLTIKYIHEFPFAMYEQFPGLMKRNKKGQYVLKNKDLQIPLLFSLKATKK